MVTVFWDSAKFAEVLVFQGTSQTCGERGALEFSHHQLIQLVQRGSSNSCASV